MKKKKFDAIFQRNLCFQWLVVTKIHTAPAALTFPKNGFQALEPTQKKYIKKHADKEYGRVFVRAFIRFGSRWEYRQGSVIFMKRISD